MKNLLLIFLVSLPFFCQAQSSRDKKAKQKTIKAATAFNYYPKIDAYSFFTNYTIQDDDLVLNFLTNNSGTFTITKGEEVPVEREFMVEVPSQLIGIGASFQIVNGNFLFHEISLTKLSFTKSSYSNNYIYPNFPDGLGNPFIIRRGYDQKTSAFAIRYELGKYFGRNKSAKVKFGISGGIEPSLYFYKRNPHFVNEFPIKGKLFTLDIALIPMLSVKLSKKLAVDFKVIPNILIADYGGVSQADPGRPSIQQGGTREYNLPEMNWAFSILLRYQVKEPKRRGRG